MGGGRMTSSDWDTFTSTHTAGRATPDAVFRRGSLHEGLNPAKIAIRESRDSADNPSSTPIIIGLDVTGSMGEIAHQIATNGLMTLFDEIYKRRPVTDPHIAFMGIGDVVYDRAPLQVSQFEADIRIAEALITLWLEGGGGPNPSESYTLPWYFAAMKVSADAVEKRRRKGYLFTVGDEQPPRQVLAAELEKVFGKGQYSTLSTAQLLDMASRNWHVVHIMVEQGNHMRDPDRHDAVVRLWRDLLGQRAILLSDYTKLAEVVVSTIQVIEGSSADAVAKSWSGDTSLVVARAVGGLTPAPGSARGTDVVEF